MCDNFFDKTENRRLKFYVIFCCFSLYVVQISDTRRGRYRTQKELSKGNKKLYNLKTLTQSFTRTRRKKFLFFCFQLSEFGFLFYSVFILEDSQLLRTWHELLFYFVSFCPVAFLSSLKHAILFQSESWDLSCGDFEKRFCKWHSIELSSQFSPQKKSFTNPKSPKKSF